MNMPEKYRKRPVVIDAMQWTGNNAAALADWCGNHFYERSQSECADGFTASLFVKANANWLGIETGEWIAKDSQGFYPIKDAVFGETYEHVGSLT